MKKTLLLLSTILFMSAALPAKGLSLALTASYLGKSDAAFKEVYGSGGFMPGLRVEAGAWKNLSIYASYGYFSKKGTTPVLEEDAKTTQHFVSAGGVWRQGLGEKLDLDLFAGLLYVSYKEEALGDEATGSAVGAELGAGLKYAVSKQISLFPFVSFRLADDTVAEMKIKLGGFGAGVGLGIRL